MDHLRDYSFGLSSPGDRQRETPHRKERHCMSIPNTSSQDFLTPYYMAARNSVCSVSDYSLRRRPITLKIMPRLDWHGDRDLRHGSEKPCRSTSAPASTESDWPFVSR
nr:PREDICTED: uncharacterized protein LOC109036551 [Bemisia tabaci]